MANVVSSIYLFIEITKPSKILHLRVLMNYFYYKLNKIILFLHFNVN